MNQVALKIMSLPPIRRSVSATKKIVLPGFDGLSLFEVTKFFFKELKNNKLNERSAAVTYNFMMAIPPTMLFLFSLIPYLPLGDVQKTIKDTIILITPNLNVRASLIEVIDEFLNQERRDLLSFGILLTLFFSSNGMMGLMRSFDRSLPVLVKRTNMNRRWTAIKLTLMLICVAILSLAVLLIQTNVVNGLLEKFFNGVVAVKILSVIVVLAIIFCSISIIYTYGPSLKKKFQFVSPGSIFATLMIGIVTTVFFSLVNNFINYNKVYGPIGTLIAIMVWMWLITLIILLGYELNISILLGKTVYAEEEEPVVANH